jgi:hypothetical protein
MKRPRAISAFFVLKKSVAEAKGFEPLYPLRDHAFQACAIDHYATLPKIDLILASSRHGGGDASSDRALYREGQAFS